MVLVGRISRPHGIRGQVVIAPDTDFVEDRFTVGATFATRSARGDEQLTIVAVRQNNGRPVVAFKGFSSINDVERLAGLELRVAEDRLRPLDDGAFYRHQLVGCAVETPDGGRVGEVTRVDGGAAGTLLALAGPHGEILIPFAADICVDVDIAARRIRIAPPAGLLELNETKDRTRTPRTIRATERSERPERP